MSDPVPVNPITDTVSVIEDCHVMTIPEMLKMMTGTSMDRILGFTGAFPEEQFEDEEKVVSQMFAFEDDQADACDVFEENIALQEAYRSEMQTKNKNLSAGDVIKQQSQADTTSTAKGGIDVKSQSQVAEGLFATAKQGKETTD